MWGYKYYVKDVIAYYISFFFLYWKLILKFCSESILIHLRSRGKELKENTL